MKTSFMYSKSHNYVSAGNIILGFIGVLTAYIGLLKGGIGWDSVSNTQQSIGTRSIKTATSLENAYDLAPGAWEFYGVVLYEFADILNRFFDSTNYYLPPESSSTYLWQGTISILLAALASSALGYSVFLVSQSKMLGTAAWALLNTTPVWLGMSHVNFKDVPVAAGLTLISSGLIVFSLRIQRQYSVYLGATFILIGTFLSVGGRAGAIVLILALYLGNFLTIFTIKIIKRHSLKQPLVSSIGSIVLIFLGLLLVRYFNPVAKIDIVQWLIDAVRLSSSFPHRLPQRIAGLDFFSTELPWWYVPVWFLAQTPILIILIIIIGLLLIIINCKKEIVILLIKRIYNFLPFFIQGLFIPLAIILSDSVIYDAVRHFLFVWPSIIVFTIVIINVLISTKIFKKYNKDFILSSSLLILIIFNLFASSRWLPYSYAFINPIAGYSSEKRHWDLDYWGVSAREGIERLEKIYDFDEIYVMPDGSSSVPYGGIGLARLEDLDLSNPFGLYVFIRWNHRIVPETCDILFEIKRDRQTLGMGGVCPKGALANTS